MARKGLLDEGASVSIGLYGAQNRALTFYDPMRHLSSPYISQNQVIEFERFWPPERLISSGAELALDAAKYVFERFNWDEMPVQMFQDEQEKLLAGRL
jgi:hypothetical protein